MINSKAAGGVMLICGTSIGTGILGIPSVTGGSGFSYSIILFIFCWLFSLVSALYLMEAHLWDDTPNSNLLSMTQNFLGPKAKSIVWIIYLALLYSLMCTYLLAGSSWVIEWTFSLTNVSLNVIPSMLIFIFLIGLFIAFGTKAVDKVNQLMLLGLIISFALIMFILLPNTKHDLLFEQAKNISTTLPALPLLITAFGYSIIVPSLSTYLDKDSKSIQKVIIIGSVITLSIYIIWEAATLGNIPLFGDHGLFQVALSKDNGTEIANSLIYFTHSKPFSIILTFFVVFAVITSFLGVSMALNHALADGLQLKSSPFSKLFLLLLTYVPPMLFLLIFPNGFTQILSWAGALVALLMGLLPIAIVWKGRYILGQGGYAVPGKKWLLILAALFFVLVIITEILR